jgi:hypothetical protein
VNFTQTHLVTMDEKDSIDFFKVTFLLFLEGCFFNTRSYQELTLAPWFILRAEVITLTFTEKNIGMNYLSKVKI